MAASISTTEKPDEAEINLNEVTNASSVEAFHETIPELSPEEAETLYKQRDFLNNTAKPAFRSAADSRRKYDQEWLARNLFWRGYHFSKYLPSSQTVVLTSRQTARLPINYTASLMRAIKNQVTSFRPKFEVMPENPTLERSRTQARYSQRILDHYFDKLKFKRKIKETIIQGLMYSIGGPWQIVYDALTKEIKVWLLDPFDFYIDPLTETSEDAQYMIKAVRRPLFEVISNPMYNPIAVNEISGGDLKIAASEYKQFMIQSIRVVNPRTTETNSPTIIMYEGDFKRYKPNGTPFMVKCIWSDQNTTPLLYEENDDDDFDYEIYSADINPKEIYGESWMKHVMPINRALDNIETSTFDYNYRVAKGRIVVDRDSGVRAINNVHGEIISKNRGAEVKSLDLPPLPVAVQQQIVRLWRYLEDISGVHEATMGRLPTGIKSGVGIAELKQADAVTQDDLIDNLEDFLSAVGKKILKKVSKHYDTYKVIRDLGIRDGDQKAFAVIGKGKKTKKNTIPGKEGQIKIGPDWLDVAEIGADNVVRVQVGSWLGYTKEALQQKVLAYFQAGLIDQATTLKLLEFGDIETIVQQSRIEQLLKRPQNAQNPQQPDQLSLAMAENDMFMDGKMPPVSELDDHLVHIAIHQEALGRGMDEIVMDHISQHQLMAGNSPVEPQNAPVGQPGPQMTGSQPTNEAATQNFFGEAASNPTPQGNVQSSVNSLAANMPPAEGMR